MNQQGIEIKRNFSKLAEASALEGTMEDIYQIAQLLKALIHKTMTVKHEQSMDGREPCPQL